MPYIPGTGRLTDVFRSPTVNINGVPVALWLPPRESPTFPGLDLFAEIVAAAAEASTLFTSGDATQATGQQDDPNLVAVQNNPAQFKNAAAAAAGSKENCACTPDNTEGVVDTGPPPVCESGASTVVPFLASCLAEAKKGTWRETGQHGGASNPNIINMWKNIGLSYSSDQTAWCAGFANFALKQSGLKWIKEAGARRQASRCAEYGGQIVPISNMQAGDLVLWSCGHVSFCYTANHGVYTFVGGNQGPGKNATPPVRDPGNDGDVSISWASGWTPSRGGIQSVVHITC